MLNMLWVPRHKQTKNLDIIILEYKKMYVQKFICWLKVSSNLQVIILNGPLGFKAVNEKKYRLFRETIACFRQIKQFLS